MRSPVIVLAALLLLPAAAAAEPSAPPAPEPPATEAETRSAAEREGVEDDGYQVSLSLPTEEDQSAWTQPGLRVELAIGYGVLLPHGPSPRVGALSFQLRPRLRIDELWSIAATFGYGLARGGYEGVRYSAMIEPVFHPLPSLGVSLGVGYAGFSVVRSTGVEAGSVDEVASRTLRDDERLAACAGGGWISQGRVEYLAVVGQLFSTGPYLTADGQWTGCEENLGKTDLETGETVVRRQWWLHLGGSLGWWLSWR